MQISKTDFFDSDSVLIVWEVVIGKRNNITRFYILGIFKLMHYYANFKNWFKTE